MRGIALIMAALLLLSSCSSERREPDENTRWIDVYYRGTGDKIVSTEQRAVSTDDNITAQIKNSVELMAQRPVSGNMQSVFPQGMVIQGVKFDKGAVALEFSREYLSLSEFDRTTAEYAILMTLSNFWSVESIQIFVDGIPCSPELSTSDIIVIPPEKRE